MSSDNLNTVIVFSQRRLSATEKIAIENKAREMAIAGCFLYTNTFTDLQQKINKSSGVNTLVIAYGSSDTINQLQQQVDFKDAALIPAAATAMPLEGASNFCWSNWGDEISGPLELNNEKILESIKRYADVNNLTMAKKIAASTNRNKSADLYEGDLIRVINNNNNQNVNEVENVIKIGVGEIDFVYATNEVSDVCLKSEGNSHLFALDSLLVSQPFRDKAKYYRYVGEGFVKFYNNNLEELNVKATLETSAAAGYEVGPIEWNSLNQVPTGVEMTANHAGNCFRAAKYYGLL